METSASLTQKVTCGIIVTNGNVFLIGTLEGSRFWDLPKGMKNPSETPIQAAVRELKEETNVEVSPNDLIELGRYQYRPEKDAHLFLCMCKELPSIERMKCSTTIIINGEDTKLPEMNKYKYIHFNEAGYYVGRNMQRVLCAIEKRMKELIG